MKFKVSLKHVEVGKEVGRLENSGRLFPCFICRSVTGWRNNGDGTSPGVPCCSDECLDVQDENERAIKASTTETLRIEEPETNLGQCQTPERESEHEQAQGAT